MLQSALATGNSEEGQARLYLNVCWSVEPDVERDCKTCLQDIPRPKLRGVPGKSPPRQEVALPHISTQIVSRSIKPLRQLRRRKRVRKRGKPKRRENIEVTAKTGRLKPTGCSRASPTDCMACNVNGKASV